MKKLFSLLLALCLMFLLSACNNKNQESQNTNSTENYYVDETTSEIIDSTTSEVVTDDNIKVDQTTSEIIDTSKTDDETTSEVVTDDNIKVDQTTSEIIDTSKTDDEKPSSSEKDDKNEKPENTTKPTDDKNNESNKQDVENQTPDTTTGETKPATCSHNNTTVKNKASATCTKAGYTGDTYCNDCKKTIKTGSSIDATGHKDTEIRGKKEATKTSEGYTGDTHCKTCGEKITTGKAIPKIEDNTPDKVTYETNNGYTYVVDEGVDITEYTMALKTKQITSLYREVEKEILRLCNIEREKVGLKPLTWYEDPYYFAHIRAEEIYVYWGHQRPNKTPWHTVYTDTGVILNCAYGENLAQFEGWAAEQIAQGAVELWMNSPGHRENILRESFTKMTIAIDCSDDGIAFSIVQHFFG